MDTVAPARAIPGDVQGALADLDMPAYAIDTLGVVRWQNAASIRLVGDARGRQFTTVISPQQALEARETFTRNILGAQGVKDATVELVQPDGRRVKVEICSAPLLDDHRVVGMFGLATRVREPTPPPAHTHLTPRQHQILVLLARGHSTEQMAAELHLTVVTIRNHVRRLLRALGAHSRLEAIVIARRDGLLD
jgi:DNA-binding CsgD family transcriptional regulator